MAGLPASLSRPARRTSMPRRVGGRPSRRSSPGRAGSSRSGRRTACAPWRRRPTRRCSPGRCRRSPRRRSSARSRARDIAILKPSPTSPSSASSPTSTPSSASDGGVGGAQAELAVDLLGREAVGVGRDEEAGEPAMGLLGVGLGEDERDLGDVAERDPHLLAADPPAAVDLLGPGAHRGGVRAGVGLGQAEAPERLARAQPRQPALLLLLGSPALDRAADERGLHRDDGAHRGVAAPDLLDDQPVAHVVEPARRRTPRRPARRGSPCRPAGGRARRRTCCARSLSRARGTISLSANSRAVSWISCCSSVSVEVHGHSLAVEPVGDRRSSKASRASLVRGPAAIELVAVDRGAPAAPRAPSRRGRPRCAPSRSSRWKSPSSTPASSSIRTPAGDRVEDARAECWACAASPSARPRRSSRSAPRGPCRRAGRAPPRRRPGPWRSASPACWPRRRAT